MKANYLFSISHKEFLLESVTYYVHHCIIKSEATLLTKKLKKSWQEVDATSNGENILMLFATF